jgi:hypothetical protein
MLECFSVMISILGKEQREWKKERHRAAEYRFLDRISDQPGPV